MSDGVDLARLRADIRHDFSLEISGLRPLSRRPGGSQVFTGQLLDQAVVVRLSRGRERFAVEVWAYRELDCLGVPVPQVLAYHEDPPRLGRPTLIMSKLPGQRLGAPGPSLDEQRATYVDLGRIVHRMHELRTAGFGPLAADGEQMVGRYSSWQAYLADLPRAWIVHYLCRHGLVDEDEEEMLIDQFNRLDDVRLDRAVFLHNDLNPHNILVDGGRVAGIIDPESANAGDPRLDIAGLSLWQTDWQRQAFAEGYGTLASDPWVACYRVLVAAQKLAWRHKGGRTAGAEHARLALKEALRDPNLPPTVRGG